MEQTPQQVARDLLCGIDVYKHLVERTQDEMILIAEAVIDLGAYIGATVGLDTGTSSTLVAMQIGGCKLVSVLKELRPHFLYHILATIYNFRGEGGKYVLRSWINDSEGKLGKYIATGSRLEEFSVDLVNKNLLPKYSPTEGGGWASQQEIAIVNRVRAEGRSLVPNF